MNKIMKVIDLLNKIANGEEVPSLIKYEYDNDVYQWNLFVKDYEKIGHTDDVGGTSKCKTNLFKDCICNLDLNDEIEILEKNMEEIKEINIEKNENNQDTYLKFRNYRGVITEDYSTTNVFFANKINELIRVANNLIKEAGNSNE